jgi:DNA-binding transcriptional LysR family regulator
VAGAGESTTLWLAGGRLRLTSLVMELRQLRYFVAVAEELHFARAAARLLIAGPSLSQQIKALERDLSVVLFDRSSTGVTLTPAGEQLLPYARATLGAAEQLGAAAQRVAAQRATLLRLGFLGFTLTAATRRLLTEFGRKAPEVTVQMRQYEWDDPTAGLLSGETDAALVRPPFTGDDQLSMLDLASEPLLAIVAEGHEFASVDSVTSARLEKEPWLEAEAVTDPIFADYWYLLGGRDGSTSVRTAAGTIEEWLAEIAFGRGVNVVPAGLAEEYRRPGLAFVPVSDAPESRLVLAWRGENPPEGVTSLASFAVRWLRSAR